MDAKKRLLGVDLCRGIAAYAVIVVHSGDETWGVPVDPWAGIFRLSFYFAVPFFLAASFFFTVHRRAPKSTPAFWKSRIEKLVIPYLTWSAIYLALRVTFFLKSNQPDRLVQLIQDPIAILFFGGASYHLYFLPLLFVGSCSVFLIGFLQEKKLKFRLLAAFVLSILLYQHLFPFGDEIQSNLEIQPFVRLMAVYLVWTLKCLPYFFTALVLHHFILKGKISWFSSKSTMVAALVIFLNTSIFGRLIFPETVRDLLVGYSLLLLGISASNYISENNRIVSNLGICAFGIYLIHPITMNFSKLFFAKIGLTHEVSITSILAISTTTFLLSWITVNFAINYKWSAKYLFGV
jgi:peptidoglycan/LPS O-acetylase OafA/YrhL